MSLKIIVEVDGQSEQQITPVVAQFVALCSQASIKQEANQPGLNKQSQSVEVAHSTDFYRDNLALLQQTQRLVAQNQRLQEQLNQSQRLLAGTPAAKALLSQAGDSGPGGAVSVDAKSATASTATDSQKSQPPALPAQYQAGRANAVCRQLARRLLALTRGRWAAFQPQRWLLFLLMGGVTYGALALWPKLIEQLGSKPEFVESAQERPGEVAPTPESTQPEVPKAAQSDRPPQPTKPAAPTSKAGSHPPPPPAFQQP
ncbi:MAG: hypothetical protein DCF25_20305 [Leptolyngbya foveolarum]|uniref:Uncharacterized protein n=1 Tax=Leptolyngbya foveolarum TaxID=47253 RepID=A0A2W4VUY9_9CYAN|nr:MAG: hypothetical protein DCF25_20305 [Leptolyngbya foveolarum]